jgi:hypothetical protein
MPPKLGHRIPPFLFSSILFIRIFTTKNTLTPFEMANKTTSILLWENKKVYESQMCMHACVRMDSRKNKWKSS